MTCSSCGRTVVSPQRVNYGSKESGYDVLCDKCYNLESAKSSGVENFQHHDFEPVRLVDCAGEAHEFHFRTRMFGTGVSINAFEVLNGQAGYRFQVIGDPAEDQMVLIGRLISKIRRALSVKHLKDTEFGLRIENDLPVRGRIGWDPDEDGSIPLVVIDGREISWDEFGRMLMTFEGWQFKLELIDPSDEA